MPFGVQVQVLSRAPDYDNFDFFRPQGDFLLPSEARNIRKLVIKNDKYLLKNFIVFQKSMVQS